MTDPNLEALYQETILEHTRRPRNFRALDGATGHAEGRNPLCGDQIGVYVRMDGDQVAEVSFQGQGCAISKASASLMTAAVAGKSRADAEALFERFHAMVTGEAGADASLGSLKVLSGVSKYPIRVKCATLAWHAMKAALSGEQTTVSSE